MTRRLEPLDLDSDLLGVIGNRPFHGLDVQVHQPKPRYVLPPEVIPGVPWPRGFREEFNAWSYVYLGVTPGLPADRIFVTNYASPGRRMHVTPDTLKALLNAIA